MGRKEEKIVSFLMEKYASTRPTTRQHSSSTSAATAGRMMVVVVVDKDGDDCLVKRAA